ncbi:ABC transporter substrate-binding protein [Microlunatus sp. GCM10028923]|uniref:ABC transporter substrate-binding protein n=1 Tax=Microlunatus sp. GCM10028923 TaxID=3273400 RepID=UPI00360F260A
MRQDGKSSMRSGRAAAVGLCVGALLLTGCTGTAGGQDADSVRVVMLGSENETLDYGAAQSYFPWVVLQNVCDSLVIREAGRSVPVLAEDITPNADATEWMIKLHPEAVFHDGDPVTAADVAASVRYFAQSPGFGGFYSVVDLNGMAAVDDHTLAVPLKVPRADFVDSVLSAASVVFEDGKGSTDVPSCSGPFELTSYSSDGGAVLTRHAEYWGSPAELARIEIRKLNDPTARVNALISGEADYAFDVPTSTAATIATSPGLRLLESGVADAGAFYFALNARVAPFDDPQVRRALKLAVDREQLVGVVLGDYGETGNDLFGKGQPGYLGELEQRERDVAEARRILRAAGVTELTVLVSESIPGLTVSAELLAQQLQEVGVTVTLNEVDPSSFFTDPDRLHESQVIAWYAANQGPLAGLEAWYGADNPYAQTGWDPKEFTRLAAVARGSANEAERALALEQLQRLQWEDGGYLIWGYRNQLSGAVEGFSGVVLNQGMPLFGSATLG